MKHQCPICGYPGMTEPPEGYYICPSCGTEFGNDDTVFSYDELRTQWINRGMPWFSRATLRPVDWDAERQLIRAGHWDAIRHLIELKERLNLSVGNREKVKTVVVPGSPQLVFC